MAAAAFVSTNIDNAVVTMAMVAAAPGARADGSRRAGGRVRRAGPAAVAVAIALFEIPTRLIGLLGLVPLALGLRGLVALRHPEARVARRPPGLRAGFVAAALVTIGAGGDNLAVYIPLFRGRRAEGRVVTVVVFVVARRPAHPLRPGAGRHPRTRAP